MPLRSIVPLKAMVALALLAAPLPLQAQTAAPAAPAAAGPSVTVTQAQTTEIVQSVVVSGSIVARDEILVAPEVDGLAIVELLAEEGDKVARGQVLARLSRVTLDVQKVQNDAQIARAEALVAQRGTGTALPLLPDARQFALLDAKMLSTDITPLYGRAPDAKLPGSKP